MALGTPDARFGETLPCGSWPKSPPPSSPHRVLTTLGAADRLLALKVRVPETLSVVGFGDGPWQKLWGPGLTTLSLPAETIGDECGRWFLQQLRNKRTSDDDKSHAVVSKMTLVVRGSTAPPR